VVEFIDEKNKNYYMKVVESVLNLSKGDIDGVHKEFFLLLKINPNQINDIKYILN